MGEPWNNWFHCSGNTYGTWIRGDERGWRTRHHREHVEGDYRNPPEAGTFEKTKDLSERIMKRDRVVLDHDLRELACRLMGQSLLRDNVELIDLCVGARHWHLLARFLPIGSRRQELREPRILIGRAKARTAREMSRRGLVGLGGIWGVRCKCDPVRDRAHQINVAKYIRKHARQGAVVWSMLKEDQTPRD